MHLIVAEPRGDRAPGKEERRTLMPWRDPSKSGGGKTNVESDLQVRGCGPPQERVTAPGRGTGVGQEKLPEGEAWKNGWRSPGGHGAGGGLEGTFQLSLPHVQRPRMFIPW